MRLQCDSVIRNIYLIVFIKIKDLVIILVHNTCKLLEYLDKKSLLKLLVLQICEVLSDGHYGRIAHLRSIHKWKRCFQAGNSGPGFQL